MTENNIYVYFDLQSLQPDPRRFKPSSPILVPSTKIENPIVIVVPVPIEAKYIHNLQQVLDNQAGKAALDAIVLTPDGLRYVIDTLEGAMAEKERETVNDDEWENVQPSKQKQSSKSVMPSWDDDDWEDNDTDWND